MRKITEIIVHCTATPAGLPVTVEQIDAYHRSLGWAGIGYHYLIDLKGQIHKGRDIRRPGAHCRGHNAHSIGVAYVGGLSPDGLAACDTRTDAQRLAMAALLKRLHREFPGSTICGHRDFAAKPPSDAMTLSVGHIVRGIDAYCRRDWPVALREFSSMRDAGDVDSVTAVGIQCKGAYYEAMTYETMGDRERASAILDSLCDRVGAIDYPQASIWLHKHLGHFYNRRGMTSRAEHHELAYYRAIASINASKDVHSMDIMRVRLGIRELHDKNAIVVRHDRVWRTVLIAGAVIALLLSLFLAYALLMSRRSNRRIMSLYKRNREILAEMKRREAEETAAAEAAIAETPRAEKYGGSGMDNATADILVHRIRRVLADPQYYLSSDFSLRQLAQLVGSNTAYVSQTINTTTGRSFKELLGVKRVAEACRLLTEGNADMTVETVANAVGFKSRTAFAAVFKQITGLTPTEFRNAARKAGQESDGRDL